MPLLIDAWNVLHTTGVLPPEMAGVGLRGLGQLIQRSRWGSQRVQLICDGRPPGPHSGLPHGMTAIFSGPDREADDLIEARIATTSAPGSLTVVSSDRRIRTAARKRGCKVLTSAAFLEALVRDAQQPRRTGPTRPTQVDLPDDLIAEAQSLAGSAPPPLPPSVPSPAPPEPPPKTDASPPAQPPTSGDLPADIIEEARRLLRGDQDQG